LSGSDGPAQRGKGQPYQDGEPRTTLYALLHKIFDERPRSSVYKQLSRNGR
jgi:hypothetical protein